VAASAAELPLLRLSPRFSHLLLSAKSPVVGLVRRRGFGIEKDVESKRLIDCYAGRDESFCPPPVIQFIELVKAREMLHRTLPGGLVP